MRELWNRAEEKCLLQRWTLDHCVPSVTNELRVDKQVADWKLQQDIFENLWDRECFSLCLIHDGEFLPQESNVRWLSVEWTIWTRMCIYAWRQQRVIPSFESWDTWLLLILFAEEHYFAFLTWRVSINEKLHSTNCRSDAIIIGMRNVKFFSPFPAFPPRLLTEEASPV